MSKQAKPIISIHVDETELGIKWTLSILGEVKNAGYALNVWAALDAANDELAKQVEQLTGALYQSELAKRKEK